MERFKNWDEVEAHYGGLTEAEEKLKEDIAKGWPCVLGDDLPDAPEDWDHPDRERHIRADVLRFLLTREADHPDVTELGVVVEGALISGSLNLMDCTIQGIAMMPHCRFQEPIHCARAEFRKTLNLVGSHLPSLQGVGCKIGGQLNCKGASFSAEVGSALSLQHAEIRETVFLTYITAKATVELRSAKIGGQLTCDGASFSAKDGDALDLQGAEVKDGFFFRDIKAVEGWIDLTSAHVHDLNDDVKSWDKVDDLILDGFTYDRIGPSAPTDHKTRLTWLAKGDHYEDIFFPQPYTQLAKVLAEMGHERDVREVRVVLARKLAREDRLVVHEDLYARERRFKAPNAPGQYIGTALHRLLRWSVVGTMRFWNWLFDSLVGYGFKPFKSLRALLLLIVILWPITSLTWFYGDFAPNSALILNSAAWTALDATPNPAEAWNDTLQGKDWETFSSLAYAADVVIPIVEIGQTQAWAPSPARGNWGTALWVGKWLFTAAGWIVTALGAAAITGVIRRE